MYKFKVGDKVRLVNEEVCKMNGIGSLALHEQGVIVEVDTEDKTTTLIHKVAIRDGRYLFWCSEEMMELA